MEPVKGYSCTFLPCGFSGRPAKTSSWLESKQQKERMKEMEVQIESICRNIEEGSIFSKGCKYVAQIKLSKCGHSLKNSSQGVSPTVGLLHSH